MFLSACFTHVRYFFSTYIYTYYTYHWSSFLFQALLSFQETLDSVLNDLQGMIVIMKKAVTEVSVIATRLDTSDMHDIIWNVPKFTLKSNNRLYLSSCSSRLYLSSHSCRLYFNNSIRYLCKALSDDLYQNITQLLIWKFFSCHTQVCCIRIYTVFYSNIIFSTYVS